MMPPLPAGPFGVIYADPPWAFLTHSKTRTIPHRCAEEHYRTVDTADLAKLPIERIAAKDCALFMWAVGSHVADAIDLARAWGFEFKTDAFYWAKRVQLRADEVALIDDGGLDGLFRIGMGYWTRKQVEPCLLFTRGKPRRKSKGVRQLVVEPIREHSRKPDVVRDRIKALVDGPYLEMFARTAAPGWSAWGNETDRFGAAA